MTDVLVIGAGVNGLVAATYLAKAGAKVTVLEAAAVPGGCCADRIAVGAEAVSAGPHTLTSLDPRVVKDLKLTRLGLGFAGRDLPLTALLCGKVLTLSRDVHASSRALAAYSAKDAERWGPFRRAHDAFARAMRALWWDDGMPSGIATLAEMRRLKVTSAVSFFESIFESETVRAAFAFDALATDPAAAGGALLAAWSAAQEMCGLQGAVAVPIGGPQALVDALAQAAAAAGVALRCGAAVARLVLDGEAVRGAVLDSGETVAGRTILSSLSRRTSLLQLLPPGAAGFAAAERLARPAEVGEGRLVLTLKACPPALAVPARFVIGDTLDGAAIAYAEARARRIPSDLYLEAVTPVPDVAVPGILLSVVIRPLPLDPADGWTAVAERLAAKVLRLLQERIPALGSNVTGLALVPPKACDAPDLAALAAPWQSRIATPVRGFYLCGPAAEPFAAMSGRAGRIAAALAAHNMKEAR